MKNEENSNGENVEELDKNVISPEEVTEVINGDEVALAEQMERTKALTKEQQLEAIKNAEKVKAEQKAKEEARLQKEKRIQEEARKRIEAEKAKAEAKKAAELKAKEDARKAAELKAQEEARKAAELKAQEEARKAAALKAQEDARKAAELKAQEDAKKAAELKAQEEAKKAAELKIKEQKNNEPTTFKRVMAAILFIALFAIVYFLPEISEAINNFNKSRMPEPVITNGISTCKLSRTTENLDIDNTVKFSIINSKLYKLEYITTTTGDKVEDEEELKEKNEKCILLKEYAGKLDGVSIACSLSNGSSTTKQVLDYEKLDLKKVTSAYTEAGGIYPEFKKNDNIDNIESKMKSSGYECTRS